MLFNCISLEICATDMHTHTHNLVQLIFACLSPDVRYKVNQNIFFMELQIYSIQITIDGQINSINR